MRAGLQRLLVSVALFLGAFLLLAGGSGALREPAFPGGTSRPPTGPLPAFGVAAERAVTEFMGSGDHSAVAWNSATGLWGGHTRPNWWQSALAVLTIVRYAERTHDVDPRYQQLLMHTYRRNIFKPRSTARREFANEFMDDTAWWGIAWLEASRYELYDRRDLADAARFLAVAEWDARYIASQPRPCGGIEWAMRRGPDTITSAEFVSLAAGLASYRSTPGIFRDPGRASMWVGEARDAFGWLERTGLVNMRSGKVLNGVNGACTRDIGGSMTYTEGEVAEALVQIGTALHQRSYYRQAAIFLRYALSPQAQLSSHGILRDHCEAQLGGCGRLHYGLDIPAYKGLFVDAVVDWSMATKSREFSGFLRAQANAVVSEGIQIPFDAAGRCGTPHSCQFGLHWASPPAESPGSDSPTVGGQESAIDALTAVLPRHAAGASRLHS